MRCRDCGCTEDNCAACRDRTGAPCWWVARDLCSACVPRYRAIAGLITAIGDQALQASRGHSVVMLLIDNDGTLHLGSSHVESGIEITLKLRGMIATALGAPDVPGVEQSVSIGIQPRPNDRAQCAYCGEMFTVDEGRAHMRTCERSPLAQDLAAAKKRIAQLEVELADARSDRVEVAPVWAPAPKAEG